ncbi:MAG: hypothetical protein ACP5MI_00335 [Candidatus Kryptoniota bacterium]
MKLRMKDIDMLLLVCIYLLLFLVYPFFPMKPIIAYSIVYIFTSLVFIPLSALFVIRRNISKSNFRVLLAIALILRIGLISVNPTGSDDYYRYLWDGKVMAHRINPYKYAPDDPALVKLHSKNLPSKVSFPYIKTIYPPLAECLFCGAYLIGGEHFIGLKILLLLFDLLTIAGILLILNKLKLRYENVLLYALSPLVLFQFFVDSHVDGFGISFLIFALFFYLDGKKILSYILLGLSICIKPTPLILIPIIFFSERNTIERIKALFIPGIVCLFFYIPFVFSGSPFQALIQYAENWTFNGIVFNLLNLFINDNQKSRALCALLLAISYFPVLTSKKSITEKIYLSVFLLLIFSPVVHPWYLSWLVAILPLEPELSGIAYVNLVSLTSLTVVTYQLTGLWKEYPFVLLAEYLPVLLIFIFEVMKKDRTPLMNPPLI